MLYVGVVGIAFLMAYWLTGRLCVSSSRLYILDHPNERSLHEMPTPRMGGVAILVTVFASIAFPLLLAHVIEWLSVNLGDALTGDKGNHSILWMVGVCAILGLISWWDDKHDLSSAVRFLIHATAAAGFIGSTGLMIEDMTIPILGSVTFGWLALPVTWLFLLWMTNLYNFMDGMDGFAGGMAVIGFGVLGYLAWQNNSTDLGVFAWLVAAATAGFLVYNLPPAKIFMGDVGSVTLGFLAGAFSLLAVHGRAFGLVESFIVFSPFIVDATVTLFRRLFQGKPIWQAHREHYYQRLVLAGWGHRKTVGVEYVLMAVCGMAAVMYNRADPHSRLAILVAVSLLYIMLAWGVRWVEQRTRRMRVGG